MWYLHVCIPYRVCTRFRNSHCFKSPACHPVAKKHPSRTPRTPISAVATPTCSANSGPRQCNREAVLFSAESCCSCLFFFSFIALACTLFRLTTETHPRHMQGKTVRRSNCVCHDHPHTGHFFNKPILFIHSSNVLYCSERSSTKLCIQATRQHERRPTPRSVAPA